VLLELELLDGAPELLEPFRPVEPEPLMLPEPERDPEAEPRFRSEAPPRAPVESQVLLPETAPAAGVVEDEPLIDVLL